jgi:hypothetical protein
MSEPTTRDPKVGGPHIDSETREIAFPFTREAIAAAEVALTQGSRPITLDLLGLASDEHRRQALTGDIGPDVVRSHVDAFIERLKALRMTGATFSHLTELLMSSNPSTTTPSRPAAAARGPTFRDWLKDLRRHGGESDVVLSAWVVRQAAEEVDAALRNSAAKFHHVTNPSADVKEVDFSEWSVLSNEARAHGLDPLSAEDAALRAVRQVTGDPHWQAPKSTEDRFKADDAAARRLEKERQRAEEDNRARQLENERLTQERLMREAEVRVREADVRAKEVERLARDADRQAKEVEAQLERKRAEKAIADADRARSLAEIAAKEAEQQRLKLEQEREVRSIQQAVVTFALRGMGIGAAVGLLVALITGVFSDASTIALLEAREDMVAALPEARIRELCGLGRDLDSRRATLNAELKLRLEAIPLPNERAKARLMAEPVCSPARNKAPLETPR